MINDVFLKSEDLLLEQYMSVKNNILADVIFALSVYDSNSDLTAESLRQIIIHNFGSEIELKKFLKYYKINGYEEILEQIGSSASKPPIRSMYKLQQIILANIENKSIFDDNMHDFLDSLDEGDSAQSKKYYKKLNNSQKNIIEEEILNWINN